MNTQSAPGITANSVPFVTIVMPVRNEAGFIRSNLLSLLRQTYPQDRMEILVIDGMSDDGTRDIVSELSAEHPSIRLIDNPGRIVPGGLNLAIKQARGEIIIRVDGHVEVADDFIEASVGALADQPTAWGVGGPIIHAGKTNTGKAVAAAMSHRIGVGGASHRLKDFEGFGEGTAFPAFYNWVFDKAGLYDEQLVRNQDDEFYFRVIQAGGKFYITPRIRYTYYVRDRLGQLYRQYFQYGFWRIPVMRKHRRPTTLRQILPSLFYLTMAVLLFVGAIMGSWLVALALPAVYVSILFIVGLSLIPELGASVALRVPLAIGTMHAAYAIGMIYGFLSWFTRRNAWGQDSSMSRLSR